MSSILSKALPLVVFSLSLVGIPAEVQAQEWEKFFARINPNKLRVGFDGATTFKSGAEGLWLKSDGRYAKTATGVTTVGGFDAYCNEYSKNCGRYEASGSQYTLYSTPSSDNPPKTYTFNRLNQIESTMSNDNVTYYSVVSIPSDINFRFNAKVRPLDDKVYGSVYSFDKSGRFSISKPSSSSSGVKTGTYSIEGYTITFNYDTGESERRSFYFIDRKLFLNGAWYEPVK